MGLAKAYVKKSDKNRTVLIVGIVLILVATVLFGFDVYKSVKLEHVESSMKVIHKPKKGKKAYVTYDYQGERYEDKVLSYYNAFVMKNGKKFTVLIDPAKPDEPKTTNYAIDVLVMFFGVVCVVATVKNNHIG
ncbi:MAG TPA: hypothetical protein DEO82_06620 [Eubacterium sp.]|nr:hypothetical protein [Eubacterium sp.]